MPTMVCSVCCEAMSDSRLQSAADALPITLDTELNTRTGRSDDFCVPPSLL